MAEFQRNRVGSLMLKRASASRPSGDWNDNDFDVLDDGAVVPHLRENEGNLTWGRCLAPRPYAESMLRAAASTTAMIHRCSDMSAD